MLNSLNKILALMDVSQKRNLFFIFFLTIILSIFETIGIGLVLPLILSMQNLEILLLNFPQINLIISYLNFSPSKENIIIFFLIIITTVFIIKSILFSYVVFLQSRFAFQINAKASAQLLENYLSRPFHFHINKNSSDLVRNVTKECDSLSFYVVLPLLFSSVEIIVIIALFFLLLSIEPLGTIGIIIFFVPIFLAYTRLLHPFISNLGTIRQIHDGKRIKYIQESLGGIKETIIFKLKDFFLTKYENHNSLYLRSGQYHVTIQQLPRVWIEFLAVLSLMTAILFFLGKGEDFSVFISTLAVFGAAAFRILPSISRLLAQLQFLKYGQASIDLIYKDLQKNINSVNDGNPKEKKHAINFENQININNISFKYPGAEIFLFKDLNLVFDKGKFYGIVGESGSGKTSFVDLILGLLEPNSGSVTVDNNSIFNNIDEWQKKISYVPQNIFLIDDTIKNNIIMDTQNNSINEVNLSKAVDSSQLRAFLSNLENGLDTIVGERGVKLSGGERQRIGIARALYRNPDILILDEATSSLDNDTEHQFNETIKSIRNNMTIISIAHRTTTLVDCDEIYRIDKGMISFVGKFKDL